MPDSWTARATMVASTVGRSRVELTARPTSPSAWSSSTELRQLTRPRLELPEEAHVLDGDDALVGERPEQRDLSVG